MIHWTPVAERVKSSWIVGIAIATIVWSMKVIETAKIIAARINLLFGAEDWFMRAALPRGPRFLAKEGLGKPPRKSGGGGRGAVRRPQSAQYRCYPAYPRPGPAWSGARQPHPRASPIPPRSGILA